MPLSDPVLALAFQRAAADPFFAGWRMDQLGRERCLSPEQQAAALGRRLEALADLCLCRQPGDRADVERIAARLGWEAGRVAKRLGVLLPT